MKIKVIQQDIARGKKRSTMSCPVALALRRKGYKGVRVNLHSIYIGHGRWFHNSDNICNFINKFDRGLPVKPATFQAKSMEI